MNAAQRGMPARRGLTLVELMIAATLAGLVIAAAATVVRQQTRSFAALAARARAGAESRAAIDITSTIRWAAPSDLLAVDSTSIDVRAFVGASVVCDAPSDGIVDLAGLDAAFASWLGAPRPGDFLELDERDTVPRNVTTVTQRSAACGSPDTIDVIRVAFEPARRALAPATAHVVRTTRFTLYRASDRRWYLGVAERDATAWSTVQPTAGPFAAPADAGLRIELLDSLGTITTERARARSVRIVTTAVADGDAAASAMPTRQRVLSLRNGGPP